MDTPKRGRGRPPTFSREAVLDRAMQLFWERGYEATAVDDLTEAMGISPSSLYASFGDKERLYQAALDRYLEGPGSFMAAALGEPTASGAMQRLLLEAARELSDASRPGGCMVALGAIHCSPQADSIRRALTERRLASLASLQARLQRGIDEGELPGDTDAQELAVFFMAVLQGMSAQARDGATSARLEGIARRALRAW